MGIDAEELLPLYPVSKQWFKLLAERLDSVAVLYYVAALVAEADPARQPVRVDHYRQGPYDALLTLSGGRSVRSPASGADALRSQPAFPAQDDRAARWPQLPLAHADPDRL